MAMNRFGRPPEFNISGCLRDRQQNREATTRKQGPEEGRRLSASDACNCSSVVRDQKRCYSSGSVGAVPISGRIDNNQQMETTAFHGRGSAYSIAHTRPTARGGVRDPSIPRLVLRVGIEKPQDVAGRSNPSNPTKGVERKGPEIDPPLCLSPACVGIGTTGGGGMSRTCPTCGRDLVSEETLTTYEWDGVTRSYCGGCDDPKRRKDDAPALDAADILDATVRVVQYGWKQESWRVYLEVGGTPACITFPTPAMMKAVDGNTNPLTWRLENELNRSVTLEGAAKEIAEEWLSDPVEEYATVRGTVRRGGSHE